MLLRLKHLVGRLGTFSMAEVGTAVMMVVVAVVKRENILPFLLLVKEKRISFLVVVAVVPSVSSIVCVCVCICVGWCLGRSCDVPIARSSE